MSLQRDHSGRFYYCYDYTCTKCSNPFSTEKKDDTICFHCKRDADYDDAMRRGEQADIDHAQAMQDYGGN